MSKKHKKICTTLNYIQHLIILASAITGCISISVFASFFGVSIGIPSSTIGLIVCAITARIKKYNSIIKKKKKKHDEIVLFAKSELNCMEVLTSTALIDSNIRYDEFVLIINLLKEHENMKQKIKNSKTQTVHQRI